MHSAETGCNSNSISSERLKNADFADGAQVLGSGLEQSNTESMIGGRFVIPCFDLTVSADPSFFYNRTSLVRTLNRRN